MAEEDALQLQQLRQDLASTEGQLTSAQNAHESAKMSVDVLKNKLKEKIDSKNALESYIYNIKNTINDVDKIKDKLTDEDKETLESLVKETTEWIDENQNSDKEEFEEKH